jgi:hypothetical protein
MKKVAITFEVLKETEKAILFEDSRSGKARTCKRTAKEIIPTYWMPKSQLIKVDNVYYTSPFLASKMSLYGSEIPISKLEKLISAANEVLDLMKALMEISQEFVSFVHDSITRKCDKLRLEHIDAASIKTMYIKFNK